MNLIFLGAPGAGKGTQAEIVSEKLQIPTISTGVILREAMKNETEMGLKAKEYVEAGDLVPDDIIIGIIKERLSEPDCKNGFILDGVPRTVVQAEALDAMGVPIDLVINIDVPADRIIKRMGGRRVCPNCGASYHVEYKRPSKEGICDKCGTELSIRKDDEPETVKSRLQVYEEQTKPLIDYYEKTGKLRTVVGQEEIADTSRLTMEAIEGK